LPASATVNVVELVPGIVDWAKGPLAHIFGDRLADRRLSYEAISRATASFDAILLDVDNGPDGLIHAGNNRLYGHQGLAAARVALRPGGILAIWSAYPDTVFANRLRRAKFAVEEIRIRSTGGKKGAHHVIWLAAKPG
jgi:spermidine synthase